MKILHYSLGFPPYRTGGLTKFCTDLMVQQAKEGHLVGLLWSGQMGFVNKKTSIKKHRNVKLKDQLISNFEVINPLPVSYDEGITDIEAFISDSGKESYTALLNDFQPDVVHVHTLMGLHRSFLEAAKEKDIRLVFTVHDFFPICPKVTMFRCGKVCDTMQGCQNCASCNTTALSLNKIKILQSPIYRTLKDSSIVKKLRKHHRDRYLGETSSDDLIAPLNTAEDYKRLRNYYHELLELMDVIHYNSSVTKKVYESVFYISNSCIIPVTHADIKDNRKEKNYENDTLRIRYLGPQGGAKGFFFSRRLLMNYGVKSKISA